MGKGFKMLNLYYQISEKTYRFVSRRLKNIEQKFLHCWESKLLDDLKKYQGD